MPYNTIDMSSQVVKGPAPSPTRSQVMGELQEIVVPPHVAMIQYGPICGEYVAGGFQVVGTRYPPELQSFTASGALVVVGNPIVGFEHLIDEVRSKLPKCHQLIALRPCHSTAWFWDKTPSMTIEEVAEPDLVLDECPNDRKSVIRSSLEAIEGHEQRGC